MMGRMYFLWEYSIPCPVSFPVKEGDWKAPVSHLQPACSLHLSCNCDAVTPVPGSLATWKSVVVVWLIELPYTLYIKLILSKGPECLRNNRK